MSAAALSSRALAPRALNPRAVRRGDIAPPVRVVTASSEGGEDKLPEVFTASMLQNVRQKVKGFETTMAVSKLPTEEELANGRKPKAGDLVSTRVPGTRCPWVPDA